MKTIVFKGYLQNLYPEGIQVEGNSAEQCIALLANFPGFRPEDNVQHKVYLPKYPTRGALSQRTNSEVIEVVAVEKLELLPAEFSGAGGNGGLLQIVLGVVLIFVGLYFGPSLLINIGVGIALGGVLGLLMPQPQSSGTDPKSNYLAANKNTVAIGTTIPLMFGRRKVFGHIISFNITATNMGAPGPNTTPTNAGGAWGSVIDPITYNGYWSH